MFWLNTLTRVCHLDVKGEVHYDNITSITTISFILWTISENNTIRIPWSSSNLVK